MTHEKVKRRALGLIAMWSADFKDNSSLGIMEECYNNLKAKSKWLLLPNPVVEELMLEDYKFEQPAEAPPPAVDDELLRKEEEELQRVLEMSMHDKGGRNLWGNYEAASSSGAGGSSSTSNLNQPVAARPVATREPGARNAYGSDPVDTPPASVIPVAKASSPISPTANSIAASQSGIVAAAPVALPNNGIDNVITRVRALHSFQPTEPGELQFEKGDIIKVVDRNYKDWWRGQLRGRTGIFPVNYVVSNRIITFQLTLNVYDRKHSLNKPLRISLERQNRKPQYFRKRQISTNY
jgi:signal transducing adaptor molecule